MTWLILGILALLCLVVIASLKGRKGGVADLPYQKCASLFSPAEHSFLGILGQAVGDQYRIFGKVRIADVVEPRQGLGASRRQKAFNRISAKHFDFLLCAAGDLSVACAIELDDQSHGQRKRQERDAFVERLCLAVSLPLARISAKRMYTVPEVRAAIFSALERPTVSVPEPSFELSASAPGPLIARSGETPVCPRCSSPMVHRRATSGSHAGEGFWGCSRYPKCRQVIKGDVPSARDGLI